MPNKTIAEELRNLRKEKKLSQQQVADLLGIPNKSTVGSWEIGKGSPDPTTLIKLCYIYGVGFEHFASECGIDTLPFIKAKEAKPITGDRLSSERERFVDEVMKLNDADFQMIFDIFRTVRNRREDKQD